MPEQIRLQRLFDFNWDRGPNITGRAGKELSSTAISGSHFTFLRVMLCMLTTRPLSHASGLYFTAYCRLEEEVRAVDLSWIKQACLLFATDP